MLEREAHRGAHVVVVRSHALDPLLLVGAVPQVWIGALRECREKLRVALPVVIGLGRFELGCGELTDRLQHPVPLAAGRLAAADKALVDQRLQRVGVGPADGLGRVVRASAREHREPREQPLLLRHEQVVGPADGRVERLLARIGVAPAPQLDAFPEPLEQLVGGEDRNARGRELEREREVVEACAELCGRARLRERRSQGARPRCEQSRTVAVVQRRHRPRVLALQLQPLSARHEESRPVGLAEAGDLVRDLRQQVLGVVDQQERPLRGERIDERLLDGEPGALPHVERLRDRIERQRGVAHRSERDPPDAVGEILGDLGRGLQRESRLPRPAGAGQGQQPDVLTPQETDDLVELSLAAEKRRRRDGKVRLVQRLQARELGVAELEEAFRCREVLEPVLPEIAYGLSGDEVSRCL